MKLKLNIFLIVNLISVLIFIVSLFGIVNWGIASVILVTGVGLSTLIGSFFYSKKFINGKLYRGIFAIGLISIGFIIFKLGEILNRVYYDGMITGSIIVYTVAVTTLMYKMGKEQKL